MGTEPNTEEKTASASAPAPSRPVSSLNAQLMAHGYAKRPLKLDRLSDGEQVHVANVITELLGASVANLSNLEELGGRYRSLEYEHGRLFKLSEKYEREAGKLEHEVAAQRARADAAERRLKEEEDKVKALREDVARGRKAVEGFKVAGGQEAKRAQLKLDKLRDQLSRAAPISPHFELLNPVPRGAVAPSPPAGPLPLLEASLRDLADIRASLQEEAEAFRHVVVATANGLREALAAAQGGEAPRLLVPGEFFALDQTDAATGLRRKGAVRQVASWTAHPAIADAKLRALVCDARALLTAGVSPLMRDGSGTTEAEADEAAAAARAERERARAEADLRDRVKDLEVEIAIVRGREDEANKVVEELSRLNVHGSVPSTTDFEHSRLRDELVRQKRLLDAERDQLRDEATRLHELRVAVEAEQAAADAAKAAALAAQAAAEATASAARTEALNEAYAHEAEQAPAPAPASGPSASSPTSPPSQHSAQNLQPPARSALTPRKHVPHAPSPLSPHHGGAPRKLVASTSSPKPKLHVAKRPRKSLARAVIDRQHRKSIEGGVHPGAPRRRTASGGSSAAASSADSAASSSAGAPRARTPSGSRRLMAGTAASLARSSNKPEPAGRPRTAAWK